MNQLMLQRKETSILWRTGRLAFGDGIAKPLEQHEATTRPKNSEYMPHRRR